MSEIAKCPVCGDEPYSRWFEGKVEIISCCGHTVDPFDTLSSWNQYAAAMELAKVAVDWSEESASINGRYGFYERLKKANRRVREVFK